MAYGKIKADTITYDNSGSDVDTTIASLVAPKEGTAIVSTGESGTTKFLRVDGDGTCSWQVPPTVTVVDEDNMSSDSATSVPSQQSVKAYVDTADALKANLANPTFTGTVNAAALTLSGDLTVNGTTTTVSSTTVEVADKNLELGKVSTPTDTTADGGGITLKGATDKTITWANGTDSWDFNQAIKTTAGWVTVRAAEGASANLYLEADEADDDADNWKLVGNIDGTFNIANYSTGSWVTGFSMTGANDATFSGSVSDSKGDVRKILRELKSSAYTLVAADAGKCIATDSGVTVPHNVLGTGDAVTIVNNSGSDITITQASSLTMYNSADASSGNRTLASKGMATIWFSSGAEAFISGAGLS